MTVCETIQLMGYPDMFRRASSFLCREEVHMFWVFLAKVVSPCAIVAFLPKTSSPNQLYECISIPRHYRCCCIASFQGSNKVYTRMQSLAFIIDWMAWDVVRYSSGAIWTPLFSHGALFQVDGWTPYPKDHFQEPEQA